MLALLITTLLTINSAGGAPQGAPGPAQQPVQGVHRDVQYAQRAWTRKGLTSLDVYTPQGDGAKRPILLYIHGGGWAIGDKRLVQHKPEWANAHGWVFVSVNYRLSPRVEHPEHARDVAEAIAYVHEHAAQWGGDPEQIVIMGHSAGAHLAAIVASEESLLGAHDLKPSDLAGVVLLDGAGYNIPEQMQSPLLTGQVREMFETAFGDDESLWVDASPTLQAKPGDELPPLLAIHVGNRARSRVESVALVNAWEAAGAGAQIHHASDKDHAGINKLLGKENDPDTEVVETFIMSVLSAD